MTRTYFNGVHNISSNGRTISFVLDDRYETKSQGEVTSDVVELITDIDAAEEILSYVLAEIEKIKSLRLSENNSVEITAAPEEGSDQKPPLGRQLNSFPTD